MRLIIGSSKVFLIISMTQRKKVVGSEEMTAEKLLEELKKMVTNHSIQIDEK